MKDELYKLKQKKKRAEQQRRRRKNYRESLKTDDYVVLITGEDSKYPCAYCTHYCGFLTLNLARLHKCECKNKGQCCPQYHTDVQKYLVQDEAV